MPYTAEAEKRSLMLQWHNTKNKIKSKSLKNTIDQIWSIIWNNTPTRAKQILEKKAKNTRSKFSRRYYQKAARQISEVVKQGKAHRARQKRLRGKR